MEKQDKLRKALLGPELYEKCSTKFGISEKELEDRYCEIINQPELKQRLQNLDASYQYLNKCSKDDFIKMCALKHYDVSSNCLSDSDKNTIYYDQFKENYVYDIIELDCSKEKDRELLEKFQKLEQEQQNEFVDYLSLGEGCVLKKVIYYVAFNPKNDEIGAVCKTVVHDSYISISYLTTRAGKTKSPQYKGLGNLVLNYIVNKYKNDDYVGIDLQSDPNAVGFYEKYGFEKVPNIKLQYLYKFNLSKKLDELDVSTHLKFLQNSLDYAFNFKDDDLILKLKAKRVKPLESKKDQYRVYSIALKYFFNDLNITQDDFEYVVTKKKYNVIPYYLDNGFSLTDEEFYELFHQGKGIAIGVDIVKSMIKQNFKFDKYMVDFIGEESYEKNVADLFEIAVNLGFLIRPWLANDVKIRKENLDKIYKLAIDNYDKSKFEDVE